MINCDVAERQLERLRAIMHRLRAPGGCPWDAEQTHESLTSNLIEEAHECVDAIHSGDRAHMKEELGDLLLQVVFHAELAEERGDFTFDDIAQGISEKLVRRHPHVYGDSNVNDTNAVLQQWDAIKRQEKGDQQKGYLHGIGKGLPAMLRAIKLQKKAAKVGFDWPDLTAVMEKLSEEIQEFQEALVSGDRAHADEELGDVLFSLVNVMRFRNIDPEILMQRANQKFEQRFAAMEKRLTALETPLGQANLEQMEAQWQLAKSDES